MIAVPLHHCWVAYRRSCGAPGAALSLGLAGSVFIGTILMFLAIPGFIFMFFWVIFGLLLALSRARPLVPPSAEARAPQPMSLRPALR